MMIQIRQHGESDQLYDMHTFINDVSDYFEVTHWIIQIEECIGFESESMEKTYKSPRKYSTKGLASLYSRTTQTVGGLLTAYEDKNPVVKLLAIDSSYWEVESQNEEFLKYMKSKYGIYPKLTA